MTTTTRDEPMTDDTSVRATRSAKDNLTGQGTMQGTQQSSQASDQMDRDRSSRGLMRRGGVVSPFDRFFRHLDAPSLYGSHFYDNWPETISQWPSMSTDVIENDSQYVISCDLPGVDKNDIHLSVKGNILEITGERKGCKTEDCQTIHRKERYYGSFQRQLVLPDNADKDVSSIKAKFQNGELCITVPKAQSAENYNINIE